MLLKFIKAQKNDVDLLININNKAYYDDYKRFKKCPGYKICPENMEISLCRPEIDKYIIHYENIPVGAVSIQKLGRGRYFVGNLCVVPSYQRKGIGTEAMKFICEYYSDWNLISLITPVPKKENIYFYTVKCGMKIKKYSKDSGIDVAVLVKTR